ncbi:hypothetical protein MMC18_009668 [Xylographa bjoerkii]|nr:hypothetical protein [Xylographa bjoerkii]
MHLWPKVLSRLYHALSNSTNFTFTGKTPTQVLYGFRTREAFNFLRLEKEDPVDMPEGKVPEGKNILPLAEVVAYPVTTRTRRRLYQDIPIIPNTPNAPDATPPVPPAPPAPRPDLRMADMDEYRPTYINAKDAIAFAAMKMKSYYDLHHRPIFFSVGDYVNLRLHRGFAVPVI